MLRRRATNAIRGALDNWLPPVLRELTPFAWAVKRWLGPESVPDFKYRAFRMSDEEFAASYSVLGVSTQSGRLTRRCRRRTGSWKTSGRSP